ncbi:queuosine biosynthesis family protein, partial [Vibrio parahaemolyticus V-223/04]
LRTFAALNHQNQALLLLWARMTNTQRKWWLVTTPYSN